MGKWNFHLFCQIKATEMYNEGRKRSAMVLKYDPCNFFGACLSFSSVWCSVFFQHGKAKSSKGEFLAFIETHFGCLYHAKDMEIYLAYMALSSLTFWFAYFIMKFLALLHSAPSFLGPLPWLCGRNNFFQQRVYGRRQRPNIFRLKSPSCLVAGVLSAGIFCLKI